MHFGKVDNDFLRINLQFSKQRWQVNLMVTSGKGFTSSNASQILP